MNFASLLRYIAIGFLAGIILFTVAGPAITKADQMNESAVARQDTLVHNGKLTLCKLDPTHYEVVKTKKVIVTAYSSTPDQTDDTPFTTASGTRVRNGTVAMNGLKFGTKVRFPDLFGDEVFTVEDRMHSRKKNQADIWMESRQEAKQFGAKFNVKIEILDS